MEREPYILMQKIRHNGLVRQFQPSCCQSYFFLLLRSAMSEVHPTTGFSSSLATWRGCEGNSWRVAKLPLSEYYQSLTWSYASPHAFSRPLMRIRAETSSNTPFWIAMVTNHNAHRPSAKSSLRIDLLELTPSSLCRVQSLRAVYARLLAIWL